MKPHGQTEMTDCRVFSEVARIIRQRERLGNRFYLTARVYVLLSNTYKLHIRLSYNYLSEFHQLHKYMLLLFGFGFFSLDKNVLIRRINSQVGFISIPVIADKCSGKIPHQLNSIIKTQTCLSEVYLYTAHKRNMLQNSLNCIL